MQGNQCVSCGQSTYYVLRMQYLIYDISHQFDESWKHLGTRRAGCPLLRTWTSCCKGRRSCTSDLVQRALLSSLQSGMIRVLRTQSSLWSTNLGSMYILLLWKLRDLRPRLKIRGQQLLPPKCKIGEYTRCHHCIYGVYVCDCASLPCHRTLGSARR